MYTIHGFVWTPQVAGVQGFPEILLSASSNAEITARQTSLKFRDEPNIVAVDIWKDGERVDAWSDSLARRHARLEEQTLPEGVNASTVYTDVTVGKYRWIYHLDARPPEAFRQGVPHKPTQEHMTNNSIRALIERVATYDRLWANCSIGPLNDEGQEAYNEIMAEKEAE